MIADVLAHWFARALTGMLLIMSQIQDALKEQLLMYSSHAYTFIR